METRETYAEMSRIMKQANRWWEKIVPCFPASVSEEEMDMMQRDYLMKALWICQRNPYSYDPLERDEAGRMIDDRGDTSVRSFLS